MSESIWMQKGALRIGLPNSSAKPASIKTESTRDEQSRSALRLRRRRSLRRQWERHGCAERTDEDAAPEEDDEGGHEKTQESFRESWQQHTTHELRLGSPAAQPVCILPRRCSEESAS